MRLLLVILWFVTWCRCEDEAIVQLVSRLVPQWGPGHFMAIAALHSVTSATTDAALTALHAAEPLCPVTVTSRLTGPSQDSHWPEKVTRLMVLMSNSKDFTSFLDFASEDDNWNPRAKVILVFESAVTTHEVHEALSVTWSQKYQLFDTVACTLDNNNSGAAVRLFTLMPQPRPACEQPALVELSTHEAGHVRFFPKKLHDLGGCPLKVANLKIPPYFYTPDIKSLGLNAQVLDILSQRLNFTYVLEPPSRGKDFTDNIFIKTVTNILNNDIDILPYPLSNEIGDQTYPFGWRCFSIVVPKSEFLPLWMNLIIPFKKEVWIAIMVTLVLESILQFIFLPKCFWPALTAKIGMSSIQRSVHRLSSRLFLNHLFLSGIVINTAYLSALYQSLTLPKRYPDIDTVEDLMETNLPVLGYKIIKFYVGLSRDPSFIEMYKRFVTSDVDPIVAVRKVANDRNTSYINDNLLLQYIRKTLFLKENLESHQTEKVGFFLNSFLVPFGSPYSHQFNSVIRKLVQSGIYFKWEKDLVMLENFDKVITIDENLSIKHFTSAFYALLIGYFLSLISFLGEIIITRFRYLFYQFL